MRRPPSVLVPHTRPSATRRPYCYTHATSYERGAAYPYMYPTRRGLWGINDLSLVRGAPGATPLARRGLLLHGVV